MADFDRDIAQLTAEISQNLPAKPEPAPRLGDVIQQMGRQKLLLARKKDENFEINEIHELSEETRLYLNALQLEKLYRCRACYEPDDSRRCWFHKKYLFDKDMKAYPDEYTAFLNSQMGIVSYVELYYAYLSIQFWSMASHILFDELTGYRSITELLKQHGHQAAPDADRPNVVAMDIN